MGERVIDPEDRKALLAHSINPDNPLIPEELLIASRIIGIETRGDYPYVGVDFVLSVDGTFKYLETNIGPNIPPERVGLPETASPMDSNLKFMDKIIASMGK